MKQIEDLDLFSALYVFMERFSDHALLCSMFADEAGLFNQIVVNCQIRRHMAPPYTRSYTILCVKSSRFVQQMCKNVG
jgi:hypothetical protein